MRRRGGILHFFCTLVSAEKLSPTAYISGASPRTNRRDGTNLSCAPNNYSGTGEASAVRDVSRATSFATSGVKVKIA